MRILFVLENYVPHIGGVEVVFKELGEGLARLGHKVDIVTHRLAGTKKFEIINGVNVHRVGCLHSRYLFTFASIPKVLKIAEKADVIHTTTFNGAFPAWLASKLKKKPAIITIHEVWIKEWGKLTDMNPVNCAVHDILERMIYMLGFDKWICVSNSTKKQLSKIKKKGNIGVIHNGVDYSHWNPRLYNGKKIREKLGLKKNFIYMFTGRPGVSKGLEFLIKAVPVISKSIPNAKLVAIVSKDKAYLKKRNQILRLIRKLNVQNKVIFLDPVKYKELPNYIMASNCIVVPSLSEGFGFAAAEAIALNKPVVVSNTTSLPEVVSGKYVLVKPANPEDIAKGVIAVYKGKAKRKTKKIFSLKKNINSYLKVYRKLFKTFSA